MPERRSSLLGPDSLTEVGGSQDRLCALCPTILLLPIPGTSSSSHESGLPILRVCGLSALSRIAWLLQGSPVSFPYFCGGRFAAATEATMRLLLYDATGKMVRDYTPQLKSFSGLISRQDVRINIAGLPAGLYFVVTVNEQGMHARKLVVLQ